MSTKTILIYTGTFDPFHAGHAWALETAGRAYTFEKALIGMHYNNDFKPDATDFSHRQKMTELGVEAANFPFEVEIRPLFHGPFEKFLQDNAPDHRLIRIVGSDTIVKTITDGHLSRLSLCHYGIVVRSLVSIDEVRAVIDSLPAEVRANFTFDILGHQPEALEARKLRADIRSTMAQSALAPSVADYIREQSLYF